MLSHEPSMEPLLPQGEGWDEGLAAYRVAPRSISPHAAANCAVGVERDNAISSASISASIPSNSGVVM